MNDWLHSRLLRYDPATMWGIFKKTEPTPSSVAIVILERKFQHLSSVELNPAMQRAWRQRYDPKTFCATMGGEQSRPVLKAFGQSFQVTQAQKPLDLKPYGKDVELPGWAFHRFHTTVEYECASLPEAEERKKTYCMLGLLCNELIQSETVGFFFVAERVFARNSIALQEKMSSGHPLDPYELANLVLRRSTTK
jgi:hypothetical protein